jgi:hypothetical protein
MTYPYIMILREDSLHRLYEKVIEKEVNDTMLGALHYLAEDDQFEVFIKHKASSPEKKVVSVINIREYVNDKTIGDTYTYTIEKFYVCTQRRSEFSEVEDTYLEHDILGNNAIPEQYLHGRYFDYWDIVPADAITKKFINDLVETKDIYIYIQWEHNSGTVYRANIYPKDYLISRSHSIHSIHVVPRKFDRDPNRSTVTKEFWLASEAVQVSVFFALTTLFIVGVFILFLTNSIGWGLTAVSALLTLVFYNIWVSTYINKDRGLSNEAFMEKYGQ